MTALPPIPSPFDAVGDPLGRLVGLTGSWEGTGFNVIWRPEFNADLDHFLELNRTTETLQFERVPGEIPNRGFLQKDIVMFGLHYLQQISDVNSGGGLHFEPGIWAHVPKTDDPHETVTVVRMASIPHGTTIVAQGTSTAADVTVRPTIPSTSIVPFSIDPPHDKVDFDERHLNIPSDFRTADLTGITQDMVTDPSSILRAAIQGQNITSTTQLHVTTNQKPVEGGGTANTAFLAGTADGPNADAAKVSAFFWLETLDHGSQPTQLQYAQTVLLNFAGLSWPHVTVATLRRTA